MMATTQRQLKLLAATVLLLGSALSARADYNFTFDKIGAITGLTPSATQSDQSSNIANYMDLILGCPIGANGCVTVSGLNLVNGTYVPGGGVAVDQTYAGDGHVVGPNGKSLTLGNSNGATNNAVMPSSTLDSFISNTADPTSTKGPLQLSQGIVITFSHGVSLTGKFSFDYEIFPDASCSTSCGSPPDLEFVVNGTTVHTFYGVAPSNPGVDGNSTSSPAMTTETAPQLIGTYSVNLTGATSLEFIDWPATIGVDNMTLTPEPKGEVFVLGLLALVAIAGAKLRRTPAKS